MTTAQPPTFLYVEDDARSREVVEFILKRVMGYTQVALFGDSERFVENLKALPFVPAVIFMDIHLRPVDGYALLALIRADPVYRATKVIALTASVMRDDVVRLEAEGFDGLIGKPVSHKSFPDLLRRILAGERIWHVS